MDVIFGINVIADCCWSVWYNQYKQTSKMMMNNNKPSNCFLINLSITGILIFISACAANKPMLDTEVDARGHPKWVTQGTNTIKTSTGRYFHGVGYARTSGDFSRQTLIADARARAELERVVSSFIEIVSRDFIASENTLLTSTNHFQVSRNIEAITEQNMSGVRVVAHWKDSGADKVYAVAQIDMAHMQKTVKEMPNLEPAFLGYFNSQGVKIFDRISRRGN